jgi:hypothetical protein
MTLLGKGILGRCYQVKMKSVLGFNSKTGVLTRGKFECRYIVETGTVVEVGFRARPLQAKAWP